MHELIESVTVKQLCETLKQLVDCLKNLRWQVIQWKLPRSKETLFYQTMNLRRDLKLCLKLEQRRDDRCSSTLSSNHHMFHDRPEIGVI